MFGRAHHLGTARIQQRAGSGEAPIVARAIAAPLLLIDDLGAEAQTQNNAIADVIRDRFDEEKPLWFTTGLTANEVAARYDGGAVRRIFERAMVIQLVRPEPA
jgi:DNA replication protein DnaC